VVGGEVLVWLWGGLGGGVGEFGLPSAGGIVTPLRSLGLPSRGGRVTPLREVLFLPSRGMLVIPS